MEYQEIPWIEKYRPTNFENIVLTPSNRRIFTNVLRTGHFPNFLLHGPPGTGKTTTVINLVNTFQRMNGKISPIIHLNASDERGIDNIRNQIMQFVSSLGMFDDGLKFVILDEVDYMTKSAQLALKCLIQSASSKVRFCLICNYISKIYSSLQNELICVRFNQLPKEDVMNFMHHIVESEKLNVDKETIQTVMDMFDSDIRSMINYLQMSIDTKMMISDDRKIELNVITRDVWEEMLKLMNDESVPVAEVVQYVHKKSCEYNCDKRHLLFSYCNFIVKNYSEMVTKQWITNVERLFNISDIDSITLVYAFVSQTR